MFKVKEKDIFSQNMSSQELYKTWLKIKAKRQEAEWVDRLEKQYNEEQENKYY